MSGEAHLVLCPGCGYSFWTREPVEAIRSWEPHCVRDDGYDYRPDGRNRWVGTRTDREVTFWPWLVDSEAIDAIARPWLYEDPERVGPPRYRLG